MRALEGERAGQQPGRVVEIEALVAADRGGKHVLGGLRVVRPRRQQQPGAERDERRVTAAHGRTGLSVRLVSLFCCSPGRSVITVSNGTKPSCSRRTRCGSPMLSLRRGMGVVPTNRPSTRTVATGWLLINTIPESGDGVAAGWRRVGGGVGGRPAPRLRARCE